jgi:hypothetical protein
MEMQTSPLKVLIYDDYAVCGSPNYAKVAEFVDKVREYLTALNRPFDLGIECNAQRVQWLISQALLPWDLMILDVMNDNLDTQVATDGSHCCGIALAHQARAKWPNAQVVFLTYLDYMHDVSADGRLSWAGWVQKWHPNTFVRLQFEITSRLAPPEEEFIVGRIRLLKDQVTIYWRDNELTKKDLTPASYSTLLALLKHTRKKLKADSKAVSLAEIASKERLSNGAIHTRMHVLLEQLSDIEEKLTGRRLPDDSVIVNERGFYRIVER